MTTVTWSPQWGVARQIQACGGVRATGADHPSAVLHTASAGLSAAGAAGLPAAGLPAAGLPAARLSAPAGRPNQQGGRRFGTGALIGAGAAGLVGGALLNEALSDDDEPDVIVNNYDEEE